MAMARARLAGRFASFLGDGEEGWRVLSKLFLLLGGEQLDIHNLTSVDLALGDEVPVYDISAALNGKATLAKVGGFCAIGVSELRLTLTSGTPITTSDVTGASTIYLTPYTGNRIRVYDGTRWLLYQTSELSLALGTLVNAQAYDVFVYDNAGTLTLETAEWANATVTMTIASPCVVTWTTHGMATGNSITFTTTGALPTGVTANTQYFITKVDANTFKLSTSLATLATSTFINTSGTQSGTHTGHQPQARQTALVLQDGVEVESGATTRLYLGSFMTTATTTTEDSEAKRFLYNSYNRVYHPAYKQNITSHTYNSATYRPWNNETTNSQIEMFIGHAQYVLLGAIVDLTSGANGLPICWAVMDWTGGPGVTASGDCIGLYGANSAPPRVTHLATNRKSISIGYHSVQLIEADLLAVTSTFTTASAQAHLII